MKDEDWPFSDPPNVAVYTCRQIVTGEEWIHYVSHDEDDGAWQFHTSDPTPVKEVDRLTVSLKRILNIDPSIRELADLPIGWHAWRDSRMSRWQRERMR